MDLTLVPGTLPEGYCPPDLQHLYDDMFGLGSATFPDTCAPVIIGQTAPPPEDQGKPWVKTDGDNGVERLYTFNNLLGAWLAKHPIDAGSNERRLWVGDVAGLKWHDGGDGNENTGQPASGAMWEIDVEFSGRSPMGVGDIAGTDPVKTLGLGENYGEGEHTLTVAETPEHDHGIDGTGKSRLMVGNTDCTLAEADVEDDQLFGMSVDRSTPPVLKTWNASGDGEAHQNTHPVRGCYLIKRTARVWYRA